MGKYRLLSLVPHARLTLVLERTPQISLCLILYGGQQHEGCVSVLFWGPSSNAWLRSIQLETNGPKKSTQLCLNKRGRLQTSGTPAPKDPPRNYLGLPFCRLKKKSLPERIARTGLILFGTNMIQTQTSMRCRGAQTTSSCILHAQTKALEVVRRRVAHHVGTGDIWLPAKPRKAWIQTKQLPEFSTIFCLPNKTFVLIAHVLLL